MRLVKEEINICGQISGQKVYKTVRKTS